MLSILKNNVRKTLIFLRLDITQNLKYDRLTKSILKKKLNPNSNCIDVGCHKGEITDLFLKYAPHGTHYCFEPIPDFYNFLKKKFKDQVYVFPHALSNKNGESDFNYVINQPAYSGIKQRKYDLSNPKIKKIKVSLKKIDALIPKETKIDLIKIDVEGGEFDVLKGGCKTIKTHRPIIIFEMGKRGADSYKTDPCEFYNFLINTLNLNIYTLKSFAYKKSYLSLSKFLNYYQTEKEYYFVASK